MARNDITGKWLDRLDNELFLQKELQQETMNMRLNRRDLIELRMLIKTCDELLKATNKAIIEGRSDDRN